MKRNKIRRILLMTIFIIGCIAACCTCLSPLIIEVCREIDARAFTDLNIFIAILKCLFHVPIIAFIFCSLIMFLSVSRK